MTYSTPEKLIGDAEKVIRNIADSCDKLTSGNVSHNKASIKMLVLHLKSHHLHLLKEHLGIKLK